MLILMSLSIISDLIYWRNRLLLSLHCIKSWRKLKVILQSSDHCLHQFLYTFAEYSALSEPVIDWEMWRIHNSFITSLRKPFVTTVRHSGPQNTKQLTRFASTVCQSLQSLVFCRLLISLLVVFCVEENWNSKLFFSIQRQRFNCIFVSLVL